MTLLQLDYIFPFVVFFYGALLTFVLNTPALMKLAEEKFPPQLHQQMNNHRILAIVCLVVGALWSLQHLWLN